MKVVHLSTYDSGGAAIAALRLHQGLLKAGFHSSFLSLHVANAGHDVSRFRYPKRALAMQKRIMRKLGLPATQKDRNDAMICHLTGRYEAFTFPLTDYQVETHPLVRDADIVHLHWVADFINYPSFFRKVSKPLVWTLHDMNPLMGGFHYTGDKERNRNWGAIEEQLRKIKESAFNDLNSLKLVTPSEWLGRHLAGYSALGRFNRTSIPYGLDMNVFKPHNRQFARAVFSIPPAKKVILFVSERIDNYRKGFDILQVALKQFDFNDNLQVVTIGMSPKELGQDEQALSLGSIKDERLLALLFSAADLFILPSREDNLPNVMLESLACGTPVLSFANGGMREVVRNGFNGILLEEISSEALRTGIAQFLNDDFVFDRAAIREYAVKNFDMNLQASRYIELYKRLD